MIWAVLGAAVGAILFMFRTVAQLDAAARARAVPIEDRTREWSEVRRAGIEVTRPAQISETTWQRLLARRPSSVRSEWN